VSFPITIKIRTEQPPDVTVRGWRDITKTAHRDQADHWRKRMLPTHFQSGAASKYGYRPRKASTIARKRRDAARGLAVAGGRLILVWSGNFRASSKHATVRAYPTRGRVDFNAPAYAPIRQRTNRQPPIADEATRVNQSEAKALTDLLESGVVRGIARNRETRTETLS